MKKKYKRMLALSLIASQVLVVSACSSGGRLEKAAEKAAEQEEQTKAKEVTYEEQLERWEKHYDQYEVSVEDAVEALEKEEVLTGSNSVVVKDSYNNPDELATYVGKVLFDFYKGEMTPEQYLTFINKFGSEDMKANNLTGNPEDDVEIVKAIQEASATQTINYAKYEISGAVIDESGDEALVYRRIQLANGTFHFFKTVLKKEEGNWYFDSDDASNPVNFVAK